MFTQCPHCQARYRITEDQLAAADGRVECGQCHASFDARATVADTLEALEELVTLSPRSDEPYITDSSEGLVELESDESAVMPARVDLAGMTEARQQPTDDGDDEVPLAIADDLVRHQQPQSATNWVYVGQWLVVLVLFVVMLGQGVYLYRYEMSRDPVYAPFVRGFCDLLGCEVPLPRVPGRIAVLERDVRLHPRVDRALVVNATLVNQADFVQAYPMIELRMSDISGTQIAGRWFRPEEYLAEAVSAFEGMVPGKEVHLLLEVVDPGEDVVSFQLNFR